MRTLAWGNKVSDRFREAVFQLCKDLGWSEQHASWLMSCMAFESGETFSSNIKNAAGSGAVGLIQFMPATAKAMGTTVEILATLTPEHQLLFVKNYFIPYAKNIESLEDMYMGILMPKYIGKPLTDVLFNDGTVAYRQNSALDADHNGHITKEEAAHKVQLKYERGMKPPLVWQEQAGYDSTHVEEFP